MVTGAMGCCKGEAMTSMPDMAGSNPQITNVATQLKVED